jgi:hypothetical protein
MFTMDDKSEEMIPALVKRLDYAPETVTRSKKDCLSRFMQPVTGSKRSVDSLYVSDN